MFFPSKNVNSDGKLIRLIRNAVVEGTFVALDAAAVSKMNAEVDPPFGSSLSSVLSDGASSFRTSDTLENFWVIQLF